MLIVNLDAHFDLRTAHEANSGTPFRQIQAWCAEQRWPFEYRVFGINRDANTTALFQRAQGWAAYWLDDALQTPDGVARRAPRWPVICKPATRSTSRSASTCCP